ncbi:MAG: hypothetical protein HUJ11_01130 [Arenibacter algicola]|nr:hypothetical protein [Arenibacter algicola]
MWKLPIPSVAGARNELEIALSRDRGEPPYNLTEPEKDAIEALYQSYDHGLGRPDDGLKAPNLAGALKDALHDAFAHVQKDKRLHDLRERLKLPADDCPYCGFGAVTDLDHYLPRSKFKSLPIYARNLVPCCGPCNGKKQALADEGAESQFLHTYFDELPDERFLFADVSIENRGLKIGFRAEQSATMEEGTIQRIVFQLERLNLNERYQREATNFVSSQAASFEMAFGEGGNTEALRDLLIRNARYHRKHFGLNDWRAALCFGLSECDQFVDGGFIEVCGLG